jgi:hypothetical protein
MNTPKNNRTHHHHHTLQATAPPSRSFTQPLFYCTTKHYNSYQHSTSHYLSLVLLDLVAHGRDGVLQALDLRVDVVHCDRTRTQPVS